MSRVSSLRLTCPARARKQPALAVRAHVAPVAEGALLLVDVRALRHRRRPWRCAVRAVTGCAARRVLAECCAPSPNQRVKRVETGGPVHVVSVVTANVRGTALSTRPSERMARACVRVTTDLLPSPATPSVLMFTTHYENHRFSDAAVRPRDYVRRCSRRFASPPGAWWLPHPSSWGRSTTLRGGRARVRYMACTPCRGTPDRYACAGTHTGIHAPSAARKCCAGRPCVLTPGVGAH